jgi:hypothetical protein
MRPFTLSCRHSRLRESYRLDVIRWLSSVRFRAGVSQSPRVLRSCSTNLADARSSASVDSSLENTHRTHRLVQFGLHCGCPPGSPSPVVGNGGPILYPCRQGQNAPSCGKHAGTSSATERANEAKHLNNANCPRLPPGSEVAGTTQSARSSRELLTGHDRHIAHGAPCQTAIRISPDRGYLRSGGRT